MDLEITIYQFQISIAVIRLINLICVNILFQILYVLSNILHMNLCNISLIMHQKYDMQLELCSLQNHTDTGREAYINHGVTLKEPFMRR